LIYLIFKDLQMRVIQNHFALTTLVGLFIWVSQCKGKNALRLGWFLKKTPYALLKRSKNNFAQMAGHILFPGLQKRHQSGIKT